MPYGNPSRLRCNARGSTLDQNPQLQLDVLERVGCIDTFTDHASGTIDDRPELTRVLERLQPGNTLVVWKLDRLGRSMRHLIDTVTALQARDVGFRSLQDSIDTTTPGRKLVFHIFAALAEFERELISERTKAGLTAARAHGRVGGRKPSMTPQKIAAAKSMRDAGDHTMAEIAAAVGVGRSTLYRHLT